jgi:drug/metabolite transporter (DMT)-like permease
MASYFLKQASGFSSIQALIIKKEFYIGGFLYLAAAVLNVITLKYMDYSIILPLASLTYIWTMIIAKMKLDEKITKRKMVGVVLIILGAIALAV